MVTKYLGIAELNKHEQANNKSIEYLEEMEYMYAVPTRGKLASCTTNKRQWQKREQHPGLLARDNQLL